MPFLGRVLVLAVIPYAIVLEPSRIWQKILKILGLVGLRQKTKNEKELTPSSTLPCNVVLFSRDTFTPVLGLQLIYV